MNISLTFILFLSLSGVHRTVARRVNNKRQDHPKDTANFEKVDDKDLGDEFRQLHPVTHASVSEVIVTQRTQTNIEHLADPVTISPSIPPTVELVTVEAVNLQLDEKSNQHDQKESSQVGYGFQFSGVVPHDIRYTIEKKTPLHELGELGGVVDGSIRGHGDDETQSGYQIGRVQVLKSLEQKEGEHNVPEVHLDTSSQLKEGPIEHLDAAIPTVPNPATSAEPVIVPIQHVVAPIQHVIAPIQHLETAAQHFDQPIPHLATPVNHLNVPIQNVQTPIYRTESIVKPTLHQITQPRLEPITQPMHSIQSSADSHSHDARKGLSIGSGLRTIAQGSADRAHSAVLNQKIAAEQAAFVAQSALAQSAIQSAATAIAALAGKEVLVSALEKQMVEAHETLDNDVNQLKSTERSTAAAKQAAEKAAYHVRVLTAALNNAQASAEHAEQTAKNSATELAAQTSMVGKARGRLDAILGKLRAAQIDFEATKQAASAAAAAAEKAQLNVLHIGEQANSHYLAGQHTSINSHAN